MPGLQIPVSNTPVPALLRCNLGCLRLCTATAARHRVTMLPRRGVAFSSKSTSTACCASSDTGNSPVDKTAQDFLTVASRSSPFQDVEATVLTDLYNRGQEETLPAGYKLSEEGAAPTACHVLLHSCFLKSNGEGRCSLTLHLCKTSQSTLRNIRYAQQGIISWDTNEYKLFIVMQPFKQKLAGLST